MPRRNDERRHRVRSQALVHGLYTAEDVVYMLAYLGAAGVYSPVEPLKPSAREVIGRFEHVCPDNSIAEVRHLITLCPRSCAWAFHTFGLSYVST